MIYLISLTLFFSAYAGDSPYLSGLKCEELVKKASDSSFTLKNLAAIRARQRCPDFNWDPQKLTPFEKELYAQEIKNAEPKALLAEPLTSEEFLKKIESEKDTTTRLSLYKNLRFFYRRAGKRAEMIKTSDLMFEWALKNYRKKKTEPAAYTALYESAQLAVRDHWTIDEVSAAEKVLSQALAQLKKKNSVAELLFLKGRIAEEGGKNSEAAALYTLVLTDLDLHQPTGLSFNRDRIRWLHAWILFKDKNYAAAEKAFAEAANLTEDLSERTRALFYQARCLKNLKQPLQAKILTESVASADFFGYYGLVAHAELGRKLPALKKIKPEYSIRYDLSLTFLSSDDRELFKALINNDEWTLVEKAAGLLGKSTADSVNIGLYLAKKHELYLPLFRVFSRLSNEEKIDVFMNYPGLIFPRPHQSKVNEMAKKTKLPASLIYAIMKQESAFNPRARSGAGALGLMQVIPPLARQLAEKFEVKAYTQPADLFEPEVNIQLGSYELMEQVQKQNGQLTLVAAAYNAGAEALAGWLRTRKRDNILEFIEEIPYEETRTYVKLIARNKLFYERISDRDSEHEFPPDFLK